MIRPSNDGMLLNVGIGLFRAVSRIFLNIFLMLVSLNLSIS